MLNDVQLERYSRQILLSKVDLQGQADLLASRILIVGAGGLGCPLAIYLARSGVGALDIVDSDKVELSNLPRQIGYQSQDVGSAKAAILARELKSISPDVQVRAHTISFSEYVCNESLSCFNLVIDATDSVSAAKDLNRASIAAKVPLLYASAIGTEGRIFASEGWRIERPCVECWLGPAERQEQGCQTMGVLSPSVGAIAVLAGVQAVKILLEQPTLGVFCIDTWTLDTMTLVLSKDPQCAACGSNSRG